MTAATPTGRRTFDLGTILTVTTGRYLANEVDGVYDLLEWVTGDKPFTHQLGRFAEEAGPAILAEHPGLASAVVPEDLSGAEPCRAWLAEQSARFGAELPVTALIAKNRHAVINPLVELINGMKP